LDTDFYNFVNKYIIDLQDRYNNEVSSQKKTLIKEEIQNAKKIIKSIYELREKKIVLAAVTKTRGGNPNLKNFLKNEVVLFDTIYNSLIKSRENVFKPTLLEKKNNKSKQKTNNGKREKKQVNIKNKKHIIRIISNISPFVGTDTKKYILKEGDIVTIEKKMKDMLLQRKVCKEIKLG
jgi:DNA replication initiation complex subunit (GINS family)